MIGLRFFPLKSADVRGEGTREARLRMSAGEATTTATAIKMSLKKRIRAASNFIALIPSCSVLELLVNFMEFVWI